MALVFHKKNSKSHCPSVNHVKVCDAPHAKQGTKQNLRHPISPQIVNERCLLAILGALR